MKAVIIREHGVAALAQILEQSMRPDYIKVKTVAVALNPTDFHHTAGAGRVGGILGCDISGIVEEVGKDCKTQVKKGDRVYAVCHGANLNGPEDGAFAEYAMVKDGHAARIPDGMSFEDAATLGVAITADGQALYLTLGLPLPDREPPVEGSPYFLVYGGSTSTGTIAIQLARLSGFKVISTASPSNFDLVKSRGADAVFDYHDPNCGAKIREYTNGSLQYAVDCIATTSSYAIVAAALPEKSDKPMHVATMLPTDTWPRTDVKATAVLAYTSVGEPFSKFGIDFPVMPGHFDFGFRFWKLSEELVARGELVPHPVALRGGGLGGIPSGIADLSKGQISGAKLVYRLEETTEEAKGHEGEEEVIEKRELGSEW